MRLTTAALILPATCERGVKSSRVSGDPCPAPRLDSALLAPNAPIGRPDSALLVPNAPIRRPDSHPPNELDSKAADLHLHELSGAAPQRGLQRLVGGRLRRLDPPRALEEPAGGAGMGGGDGELGQVLSRAFR